MRGKGPLPRDALPALGITPAYAGKSLWSGSVRVWVWDHPRVCGEKVAVCHDHASGVGSPPRMRGKEEGHPRSQGSQGITPAYAGKSDNFGAALSDFGDHPRVCGEKCSATGSGLAVSGSPPRMRGKVPVVSSVSVQFGITPAYAGKRSFAIVLSSDYWDHPRVCGEK